MGQELCKEQYRALPMEEPPMISPSTVVSGTSSVVYKRAYDARFYHFHAGCTGARVPIPLSLIHIYKLVACPTCHAHPEMHRVDPGGGKRDDYINLYGRFLDIEGIAITITWKTPNGEDQEQVVPIFVYGGSLLRFNVPKACTDTKLTIEGHYQKNSLGLVTYLVVN